VLQDLLDLDRAGALGGIRAIIAERLARVRAGHTPETDRDEHRYDGQLTSRASGLIAHGWYSKEAVTEAAALLAAEIDRLEAKP
jgi:hypothetical protein